MLQLLVKHCCTSNVKNSVSASKAHTQTIYWERHPSATRAHYARAVTHRNQDSRWRTGQTGPLNRAGVRGSAVPVLAPVCPGAGTPGPQLARLLRGCSDPAPPGRARHGCRDTGAGGEGGSRLRSGQGRGSVCAGSAEARRPRCRG